MLTENPHISVKNLNVHIDGNHILKNISIDIPDKKVTSFIGPSGCGKTTLLKTFNRLLDRQGNVEITGQVLVDGEDLYSPGYGSNSSSKKNGIAFTATVSIAYEYFMIMWLTEHVFTGNANKKELDALVEHYLRGVSLWDEVKDRLKDPATRLSIGQQQRLCLARGLAVEPEIILGDEPTSALDPISTQHIEELFLKLKDKYTRLF